ncbi:response regulator [Deltaproteobacteria bacterium]|nr:response regulator [Deltaproteobacteria bacterium]
MRNFQQIASTIQTHKKRLIAFLEEHFDESELPEELQALPTIWKEKILIVDDIESTRELFTTVLENLGTVETAANGQEALEKVRDSFFDVILSDVEMPIMNGAVFFQKAVEFDPDITRHFIFCSGRITHDIVDLCSEYDLMLLEKPVRINQLSEAVQAVLDKTD